LEWSQKVYEHTNGNILILAPLAVAAQTKREGIKFGYDVTICRSQQDVKKGINITNYDMLEHFNLNDFKGLVLDESSIIKHSTSKTRQYLIDNAKYIPYKLACTATPSPNDFMELGNHSEFLGIMTMQEMLSTFFVHDMKTTQAWRLKGHAEDKFWEWIASWAVVLQNPKDLNYQAEGYDLPELKVIEHIVKSENMEDSEGQLLFVAETSQTLQERRNARRVSLFERAALAAEIANSTDKQVLVWCDLNDESHELARIINGGIEITGADTNEYKEKQMIGFTEGDVRCLISKPKISGFGMNWQQCDTMIFVGLSDSFEAYYQAVRRCWRFGQTNSVTVHIIISEAEGAVKANIERKQKDAQRMMSEMVKHTQKILEKEIKGTVKMSDGYIPTEIMQIPHWLRSERNVS
jgi:hypothetical protein